LLERALRAAERETLRLALSSIGPWLSAFLARDPELRRRHRSLVESIRRVREPAVVVPIDSARPAAEVLVPLTERELQVLERLAQLCTTEEIAAELYVSANTVKTHIKSVFLKLAVNRRSDAVRQGRRLGLC
jgi:LuxR family maltose regulon positive regulatory protein